MSLMCPMCIGQNGLGKNRTCGSYGKNTGKAY